MQTMLKKIVCSAAALVLLLTSAPYTAAQTAVTAAGGAAVVSFDTTGFPQWVKDIRRWEIVAFGSFPFTMFTATFAMDTYRWAKTNGMDWSDEGRRYAPWPLKSAGAVNMESREQEKTIAIAAGLSIGIAIADLVIVQIKRHKARQRAESLPVGTAIIIKNPWPPDGEAEAAEAVEGEAAAGGSAAP